MIFVDGIYGAYYLIRGKTTFPIRKPDIPLSEVKMIKKGLPSNIIALGDFASWGHSF